MSIRPTHGGSAVRTWWMKSRSGATQRRADRGERNRDASRSERHVARSAACSRRPGGCPRGLRELRGSSATPLMPTLRRPPAAHTPLSARTSGIRGIPAPTPRFLPPCGRPQGLFLGGRSGGSSNSPAPSRPRPGACRIHAPNCPRLPSSAASMPRKCASTRPVTRLDVSVWHGLPPPGSMHHPEGRHPCLGFTAPSAAAESSPGAEFPTPCCTLVHMPPKRHRCRASPESTRPENQPVEWPQPTSPAST